MPDNSKLTDEQLSLMIASFLEPKPERLSTFDAHGLPIIHFVSAIGCWFIDRDDSWRPRDFVHDPAMTLMLLDKMRMDGVVTLCGSRIGFSCGTSEATGLVEHLGRCVALAFIAANNLGLEVKP